MTNESLKAAIAEFGNRVVFIIMDNDRRLRFGYPESPLQSVDQLKYKTFNGEDFFEPFRTMKSDIVIFKVPYEDSFIEECNVATTFCYNVIEIEKNVYKCDILDKIQNQKGSQIGILLTKPSFEICKSWFIKYPNNIKELYEFIDNKLSLKEV